MRVETFRVKRNVKDYLSVIIGAILMIVGFILLIKFIIEFIVLFIGSSSESTGFPQQTSVTGVINVRGGIQFSGPAW